MTTRLNILVLVAAVAPALAYAPRASSRAAPPLAASTAPGVTAGAQKPGAAEPSGPATASAPAQAGAAKFNDIHAGLEGASSQDCLGCHADAPPVIRAHASHSIELDYAAVAGKRSAEFTPLPDVQIGRAHV